jgi:hypothetical protein
LIPDADDGGARNKRPVRSGGANHIQGDSKAGITQKNMQLNFSILGKASIKSKK